MTPDDRQAVCDEARTWVGTRYMHHQRVKGRAGGVDCAQFPLAVYAACGLIPDLHPEYSEQWMLHKGEEVYLDIIHTLCVEIEGPPAPGDFAIWRFGRTYSHGAIVLDWPLIVHASAGDACVLEALADRDAGLPDRPVKFFALRA